MATDNITFLRILAAQLSGMSKLIEEHLQQADTTYTVGDLGVGQTDPVQEPQPPIIVDPEPPVVQGDWPVEWNVPHHVPSSEDPECQIVAERAGCFDKTAITETLQGLTVVEDGTIIENKRIIGGVTIKANNVTIRNCLIDGANRVGLPEINNWYGVKNMDGFTGLIVEDCEIVGVASAAIFANEGLFRRLNIHDSLKDGMKIQGPVHVAECWVHHIGIKEGSHADCVQSVNGGSGAVYTRNYMDICFYDTPDHPGAPYKSNACFIIQTTAAGTEWTEDVMIKDNWLRGGSYTIYFTNKDNATVGVRNCSVLRNKFSVRNSRNAPDSYLSTKNLTSGIVWEDNTDYELV